MVNSKKGLSKSKSIIDTIGPWSEVKLEIVERYAKEYSRILSRYPYLSHAYIDAFASPGEHTRRKSNDPVLGSPIRAIEVLPPFKRYFFIDINETKLSLLRGKIGDRKNVYIFEGDCNEVLLNNVFPKFRNNRKWRGLCLLDPYKLQLDWNVIETLIKLGTVELFLNFPMYDISRNLVSNKPDKLRKSDIIRMDRFWGDHSWFDLLYAFTPNLFGEPQAQRIGKANTVLSLAFAKKLKEAGFNYVPSPLPIKNTKGGLLYYVFFGSNKPVANKIVEYIFKKFGRT